MLDAVPLVAGIAAAGWAYGRGLRRGDRRSRADAGPFYFYGGLAALLVVLAPPFDHVAGERLWAHMVQHVVLVAVAAPLVVLGHPVATLLDAVEPGGRARWAMSLRRLADGPAARHVGMWALGAVAVHTAALWAWHIPGAFEAALASHGLHVAEHATLLATALVLWWSLVATARRARHGLGILVAFAAALQGSGLGALMTLSTTPWYEAYARASRAGLTALEDQQVAGVIMWGPSGAVYLLAAVLLFAASIRPRVAAAPAAA